jgi:hypothetical protein
MDELFGRLTSVIHREGMQAIAKLSEVKQCQDRNVMRPNAKPSRAMPATHRTENARL